MKSFACLLVAARILLTASCCCRRASSAFAASLRARSTLRSWRVVNQNTAKTPIRLMQAPTAPESSTAQCVDQVIAAGCHQHLTDQSSSSLQAGKFSTSLACKSGMVGRHALPRRGNCGGLPSRSARSRVHLINTSSSASTSLRCRANRPKVCHGAHEDGRSLGGCRCSLWLELTAGSAFPNRWA